MFLFPEWAPLTSTQINGQEFSSHISVCSPKFFNWILYLFFLSQQEFSVPSNDSFVLTTTDRIIVDADKFGK